MGEDKVVLKQLDIDNSGTLSLKEVEAWESGSYHAVDAVKFMHADKDHDETMTVDELDAARQEISQHKFEVETAISLEEFSRHLQSEGETTAEVQEEDKAIVKQLDADNSGTLSFKKVKAWQSGCYHAEE